VSLSGSLGAELLADLSLSLRRQPLPHRSPTNDASHRLARRNLVRFDVSELVSLLELTSSPPRSNGSMNDDGTSNTVIGRRSLLQN
jgi:hypothetical protein